MDKTRKIKGGVYLVIDPSMNEKELLFKFGNVLQEEIAVVQLWDNFSAERSAVIALINQVAKLCHKKDIPLLLNNNWELLADCEADGVHFDEIPENFEQLRERGGENVLFGLTVNNDLKVIEWAEEKKLDYISFCSIFPSTTSNSCELVEPASIKKARQITKMPIFLAGGIQRDNLHTLNELDFEGVAVVSGIMNAKEPAIATKNYISELKKLKK